MKIFLFGLFITLSLFCKGQAEDLFLTRQSAIDSIRKGTFVWPENKITDTSKYVLYWDGPVPCRIYYNMKKKAAPKKKAAKKKAVKKRTQDELLTSIEEKLDKLIDVSKYKSDFLQHILANHDGGIIPLSKDKFSE